MLPEGPGSGYRSGPFGIRGILPAGGLPYFSKNGPIRPHGHYNWKTHNLPKAIDTFAHAQKDFAALKYEMGANHMTAVLKKLNKEKDLPTQGQPDQQNL